MAAVFPSPQNSSTKVFDPGIFTNLGRQNRSAQSMSNTFKAFGRVIEVAGPQCLPAKSVAGSALVAASSPSDGNAFFDSEFGKRIIVKVTTPRGKRTTATQIVKDLAGTGEFRIVARLGGDEGFYMKHGEGARLFMVILEARSLTQEGINSLQEHVQHNVGRYYFSASVINPYEDKDAAVFVPNAATGEIAPCPSDRDWKPACRIIFSNITPQYLDPFQVKLKLLLYDLFNPHLESSKANLFQDREHESAHDELALFPKRAGRQSRFNALSISVRTQVHNEGYEAHRVEMKFKYKELYDFATTTFAATFGGVKASFDDFDGTVAEWLAGTPSMNGGITIGMEHAEHANDSAKDLMDPEKSVCVNRGWADTRRMYKENRQVLLGPTGLMACTSSHQENDAALAIFLARALAKVMDMSTEKATQYINEGITNKIHILSEIKGIGTNVPVSFITLQTSKQVGDLLNLAKEEDWQNKVRLDIVRAGTFNHTTDGWWNLPKQMRKQMSDNGKQVARNEKSWNSTPGVVTDTASNIATETRLQALEINMVTKEKYNALQAQTTALKANVAEVRHRLEEVQSQQSTLHAQLTASTDAKFKEAKADSDDKFSQLMEQFSQIQSNDGGREGGTKKKQNSGQ